VPDLPAYQTVRFMDGAYQVYTGPGDTWYQAPDALLTGGDCRLYGSENGWLLIGYGTPQGGYRIGYITQEALPEGITAQPLSLGSQAWTLPGPASLRDDPVMDGPPLLNLPEGTPLTLLAAIPDDPRYLYVEVANAQGNQPARGFILRSELE